jgi:hypothetical protein
LLKEKAS